MVKASLGRGLGLQQMLHAFMNTDTHAHHELPCTCILCYWFHSPQSLAPPYSLPVSSPHFECYATQNCVFTGFLLVQFYQIFWIRFLQPWFAFVLYYCLWRRGSLIDLFLPRFFELFLVFWHGVGWLSVLIWGPLWSLVTSRWFPSSTISYPSFFGLDLHSTLPALWMYALMLCYCSCFIAGISNLFLECKKGVVNVLELV